MNLYSQNTIKFLLQKTLNSISELAYVALLLRPRERLQSIVMSTSVCVCVPVGLSVCLSVREYIPEVHAGSLPVLCILPMAVARSSSGVVAIRYVLLVLRMMSCFL